MMINQMEKDHRRLSSAEVVDTDEFDDEEAKMEKFYELIRSFNQARANHQRNLQQSLRHQNHNYQVINHLHNNSSNNNNINNCQNNNNNNNGTKSLDNSLPSFISEDFRGLRENHDDQDQDQNQNQNRGVVSDKSGHDFLKNMNFVEFDNNNKKKKNVVEKLSKKRKIVDVNVVDDDEDGDYRDEEVGINNADKVKISRPQIELDLNLAL